MRRDRSVYARAMLSLTFRLHFSKSSVVVALIEGVFAHHLLTRRRLWVYRGGEEIAPGPAIRCSLRSLPRVRETCSRVPFTVTCFLTAAFRNDEWHTTRPNALRSREPFD